MRELKTLFVTDDRESYAQGNYYLAYQRAFSRHAAVILVDPKGELPDPAGFDLVVLGHAAIENFANVRGARFLPHVAIWLQHRFLRRLHTSRVPRLVFTKNDYKQFDLKSSFIDFVHPELVITHTRAALQQLKNPHGRLEWLPFGVDTHEFSRPRNDPPTRQFAVGFRANANTEWNAGERERFYRALCRLKNERSVSLTLSKTGEGFLVGKPYVDWMQSCALLGNTVSASGTVGPRFLEALACGTIPIAPRNEYEDLLIPDEHYIPVDAGDDGSFPALESRVSRFFDDPKYQQVLRAKGQALVETHSVDRHVLYVCRDFA